MNRNRLAVRAFFVRNVDPAIGVGAAEIMTQLELGDRALYGALRNRVPGQEWYRHENGRWFLGKDVPSWWDEVIGPQVLHEYLVDRVYKAPVRGRARLKVVQDEVEDWSGLLVEVAYLKALEHELKAIDQDHPVDLSRIERPLARHKVSTAPELRRHISKQLEAMGYIEVLTNRVGAPIYLTQRYFGSTEAEIEEALMSKPAPEVAFAPAEATYEEGAPDNNEGHGNLVFTRSTDRGSLVTVVTDTSRWTTEEKLALAGLVLAIPVNWIVPPH
jgi:hypothetical protein